MTNNHLALAANKRFVIQGSWIDKSTIATIGDLVTMRTRMQSDVEYAEFIFGLKCCRFDRRGKSEAEIKAYKEDIKAHRKMFHGLNAVIRFTDRKQYTLDSEFLWTGFAGRFGTVLGLMVPTSVFHPDYGQFQEPGKVTFTLRGDTAHKYHGLPRFDRWTKPRRYWGRGR